MITNLIIDGNNLAHREGFSKLDLAYEGRPTGAIYGVLQQTLKLTELYKPDHVWFCWDNSSSLRRNYHPEYKANRLGQVTSEREIILGQMLRLQFELLPRVGYENQLSQAGYEADDMIAAVAMRPENNIIVSSDNDLWQCLAWNVKIHLLGGHELMTHESFMRKYNLHPEQWIKVKAMMGDSGDNIVGIPGVGIKTATKFVQGIWNHKVSTKVTMNKELIDRNMKLIKLPWPGTSIPEPKKSNFDSSEFRNVCLEYGLTSLL